MNYGEMQRNGVSLQILALLGFFELNEVDFPQLGILGEQFLDFCLQFAFIGGFVLLNQHQQFKLCESFHILLQFPPDTAAPALETLLLDKSPPVSLSDSFNRHQQFCFIWFVWSGQDDIVDFEIEFILC